MCLGMSRNIPRPRHMLWHMHRHVPRQGICLGTCLTYASAYSSACLAASPMPRKHAFAHAYACLGKLSHMPRHDSAYGWAWFQGMGKVSKDMQSWVSLNVLNDETMGLTKCHCPVIEVISSINVFFNRRLEPNRSGGNISNHP